MENAYKKAKLPGNAGIGQLIPSEHVAVIQGKWVPSQGKGGGLSKLDHISGKNFGKFKLLAIELRPKPKVYAAGVFTKPVTPELLQAFHQQDWEVIQARELTQDERAAGPFYINAPSSDTRDAWHLTHGPVQTRLSFASRHKEGAASNFPPFAAYDYDDSLVKSSQTVIVRPTFTIQKQRLCLSTEQAAQRRKWLGGKELTAFSPVLACGEPPLKD